MIELRLIREQREEIEARLRTRDSSVDLSEIVSLDERRRELIADVERLKANRNQGSQEVGRRKRDGENADELLAGLSELSNRISELDEALRDTQAQIDEPAGTEKE